MHGGLVKPDSTAGFTQRALVKMKETAKAVSSKNQNEPSAARELEVFLDNADNIIECGRPFRDFSIDERARLNDTTPERQG